MVDLGLDFHIFLNIFLIFYNILLALRAIYRYIAGLKGQLKIFCNQRLHIIVFGLRPQLNKITYKKYS